MANNNKSRRSDSLISVRKHLANQAKQMLSKDADCKLTERQPLHSEQRPVTSKTAESNPHAPVTELTPVPNPDNGFETKPTQSIWNENLGNGSTVFPEQSSMNFNANFPQSHPAVNFLENQITPPLTSGGSQSARETKFNRTYELICQLYSLIQNETNSLLIVDNSTGKALPATFNAIEEYVTTQYRRRYSSSIPKSIIKDAFAQFMIMEIPRTMYVLFGRAGRHPFTGDRYINTGSKVIEFGYRSSSYQKTSNMPYIAPTHSFNLYLQPNIGNVTPRSIDMLFHNTALPKDTDLLVIAWMILCWMPDRSQVMLELLGSPSRSMQLTQSALKNVIDPATTALRNELPQNKAQLDAFAHQDYLLSFYHVDRLSAPMQTHFFNQMRGKMVPWQWGNKKVETEIKIQCPILLSASESIASTNKLKDATLSIEVDQSIATPSVSIDYSDLQVMTNSLLLIYGYINEQWSTIEHDRDFDCYNGLADLCRIGVLVAEYLDRDNDQFWQQLTVNQRVQREYELEENPVATALLSFIQALDKPVADMSVKGWLKQLEAHKPEPCSDHDWPTSSRKLAAEFKSIQGLMTDLGVELKSTGQKGPFRHWQATLCQTETDSPTPTLYESPSQSSNNGI